MIRGLKPPSQSWKTFLRNHAAGIAAVDMCVVPTVTFKQLFAFLVLGHGRRELLWFEVTRHPTAEWLAPQITDPPRETPPDISAAPSQGTMAVKCGGCSAATCH